MKVAYYSTGPHDAETCEWCGAEIKNVTLIAEANGTEHRLGSECGQKTIAAFYEREQAAQRADAERQRMASARTAYRRRFGDKREG